MAQLSIEARAAHLFRGNTIEARQREYVFTFTPAEIAVWERAGRVTIAEGTGEAREYLLAKRLLDIAIASFFLIVLLPVLAIVALAIRLDSPGPILFRQRRIGQRGRYFDMLKFRTMRPDRRRRQVAIDFVDRRGCLKSDRDPRVTRTGRLLRRTSLDELPQLWNVLVGEMSLVGPRPELVEMLKYYEPEHHRRHAATPGLTGWWQINGRCRRGSSIAPQEDLSQKLQDDLHYLKHRSLMFDLKIVLLTVPVVLLGRGAV